MQKTKQEYDALLAAYARRAYNESLNKDERVTDENIILEFGGSEGWQIIVDFENGMYLAKSVESTPDGPYVVYTLIDATRDWHCSAEPIYEAERELSI